VFHLRKKETNVISVYQVFNKKCSGLNLLKIKDVVGSVLGLIILIVEDQYITILRLIYTSILERVYLMV